MGRDPMIRKACEINPVEEEHVASADISSDAVATRHPASFLKSGEQLPITCLVTLDRAARVEPERVRACASPCATPTADTPIRKLRRLLERPDTATEDHHRPRPPTPVAGFV